MPMTVSELIEELKDMPQDAPIVVCHSPGGDCGYSPTIGIELGRYAPRIDNGEECTWAGEFGLPELTLEDIQDGYSQEDVLDGPIAVAIYPTF